jgi:hypothetical protein
MNSRWIDLMGGSHWWLSRGYILSQCCDDYKMGLLGKHPAFRCRPPWLAQNRFPNLAIRPCEDQADMEEAMRIHKKTDAMACPCKQRSVNFSCARGTMQVEKCWRETWPSGVYMNVMRRGTSLSVEPRQKGSRWTWFHRKKKFEN